MGDSGSINIIMTLLIDSKMYEPCIGTLVFPSHDELVKGLEYYEHVYAANSLGYSVPGEAENFQTPT
eukprot:1367998-Ditylum_brightwellii.AAC.1